MNFNPMPLFVQRLLTGVNLVAALGLLLGGAAEAQNQDLRWVDVPPATDGNVPQSESSRSGEGAAGETPGTSDFLERAPATPRTGAYDSLGGARSLFRDDEVDRGAIRPSSTGLAAARERDRWLAKAQDQALPHDYNIKIGSMLFWFDAGLSLEYSDNVTGAGSGGNFDSSRFDDRFSDPRTRDFVGTSDDGREGDFIIRPQVNMHGYLKLSQYNSLILNVGLGYVKYVNHPEFDSNSSLLYLAPGTEISFDVKVGDFLINFHERPSIPQDQTDSLTLRRTFSYSRFVNTVGVSVLWDLNRILLSAGYDHFDSIALNSDLDYLNQSSDQLHASALFKITDSFSAGIEGAASPVRYQGGVQNDGFTYNFGPFAEIQVTEFLRLRLSAGYQGGTFDSGGLNGDNSDPSGYYANVSIYNNLNAYFTHNLSFGHEGQLGTVSNFVEVNYIRYGASWDILNRTSVGGDLSFEDAEESGGFFAQDIRRYSAGVFLSYFLTKKLAVGLHYRFTKRESSGSASVAGGNSLLDYHENRIGLDFRYTF
ncbi:MAG: hypothetical protein H7Y39_11200 [Nitrospiraceae bacterium]|nr:hypothetical protein [Nitrospiraceae bacterium]